MDYEYDVFISYPRIDPIGPWVRDVFDPELRRWMRAELGPRKVFRDDSENEPGHRWPDRIAEALHRSKCMVAIWTPPFFESDWCVAEWETMRARELHLGVDHGWETGLVYPVRFSDGDYFHDDAKQVQWDDFEVFNTLRRGHAESEDYRRMIESIKLLCRRLKQRLDAPAPWDAAWPKVVPPAPARPPSMPPPGFA